MSGNFAHHVDDVRVVVDLFILGYVYVITVPRQIIPRKVNQHHVLRILLSVLFQLLSQFAICFIITSSPIRARDGMDDGFSILYDELTFRRGAHDFIFTVIEIKQIGRWVDAAERAVYVELIPTELLRETPAQHDLKHVTPQRRSNPFLHHRYIILIGHI